MSVRDVNSRERYRALVLRSERAFLSQLGDNVMQGPAAQDTVLLQLELLEQLNLTHLLLLHPRPDGDESFLQLAAIFHGDVTVMTRLANLCPPLLAQRRQGDYEGQTVLHTLVSKQNVAGVDCILTHPRLGNPALLLNAKAVGPRFRDTVMMGELPLSVAALTFNLQMVDVLLGKGARLEEVNSRGDTALHSLVRFACCNPALEGEVAAMLTQLHARLQQTAGEETDPRSVWLLENGEGVTVLRLTALLGLAELFGQVLQLEGVYCHLDHHDGLVDCLLYDVTEIDPVARHRWRAVNARRPGGGGRGAPLRADGIPSPAHPTVKDAVCSPGGSPPSAGKGRGEEGGRSVSVLDILCETRVDKAFDMLSTFVVRSVVKAKWHHYSRWFLLWALLHAILLALLTTYAVFKARLIQHAAEQSAPATPTTTTTTQTPPTPVSNTTSAPPASSAAPSPVPPASEEAFVVRVSVVLVLVSLLIVGVEGVRWRRGMRLQLWLIHHNGLYRLQLAAMATALLADCVWLWISGPVNNFFLTLALLLAWWFVTFFFRPWRKFSFFTVMLHKVLLGDMLRFSTIIVLELVAFSVAMYTTFLCTPGELPEEFRDLGVTLLTLFKLMLGLGEVEVLEEAAHPWLATLIFVLFVILTYLLMLNALIAMMANTCSLVSENKVSQWELQRLSVVLLLESMLPCDRFLYNSGRAMQVAAYDLQRKVPVQETRFFTNVTSVRTRYTARGQAILKRKSMMQTQHFDDLYSAMTPVGNVMTSVDNVVTSTSNVMTSVGNVAHLDLLASFTHQQALLTKLKMAEDDGSEDGPERWWHGPPSSSSKPARLPIVYQAPATPKEHASVQRNEDLPALKERGESGQEGLGGTLSYVAVRQNLLRAMLATPSTGRLPLERHTPSPCDALTAPSQSARTVAGARKQPWSGQVRLPSPDVYTIPHLTPANTCLHHCSPHTCQHLMSTPLVTSHLPTPDVHTIAHLTPAST